MKYVYWAALAVGVVLLLHAGLAGAAVAWNRFTTPFPLTCEPWGLFGFGCGGGVRATTDGYLLEVTLAAQALVGLLLIAAFVSYRRETTDV